MRILIAQSIPTVAIDWLRAQGAELVLAFDDDGWRDKLDEVRGLIYYSVKVDKALLDSMPALEVVGKRGVGIDTVDLEELARRGIKLTNIGGSNGNANTVAEHAITLLTAATRAIPTTDAFTRAGRFVERMSLPLVKEISESRIGIVGAGQIGGRVADILRGGFQCEIGIYDPYATPERAAQLGARAFDTVAALLEWADNAVITAPLTPETRGMIGLAELRLLGPDGIVVISSRGGIVDEPALAEAVRSRLIRGAGVDVYSPEPPPKDNPLFDLDRVVLTPHVAGASDKSRERTSLMICQQVWALLHGQPAPLVGEQAWLEYA
jgi:D-3-phosphoglycerate dehydrogenase